MEQLTHWKKLTNPNYLGSYALLPGQEIVATIKSVVNEEVVGADGKKEICSVLKFEEKDIKPMILNATNFKTIAKLFKSPYIEHWCGRRILIHSEKVKAFGETVDALRICSRLPADKKPICSDCGAEIKGFGNTNAQTVAQHTLNTYGRALCSECAMRAKAAQEASTDEGVL